MSDVVFEAACARFLRIEMLHVKIGYPLAAIGVVALIRCCGPFF